MIIIHSSWLLSIQILWTMVRHLEPESIMIPTQQSWVTSRNYVRNTNGQQIIKPKEKKRKENLLYLIYWDVDTCNETKYIKDARDRMLYQLSAVAYKWYVWMTPQIQSVRFPEITMVVCVCMLLLLDTPFEFWLLKEMGLICP